MKNRVTKVSKLIPIRKVLLSVSDKTGLEDFVIGLVQVCPQVQFYSTGGTFNSIKSMVDQGKVPPLASAKRLLEVSEYTGQPETQGGLVKTLDFKVHLGILTEEFNPYHAQDLERTGAIQFDMVVVNLYPFVKTVTEPGSDLEDARGNIDIGGPTMLRASAKNFLRVASVCDPVDYPRIIQELKAQNGRLPLETRFGLAKKTFAHTSEYDTAIASYLQLQTETALDIYKE
jgi:phosphoribosylaminoimidazolecarboxamide formyltransferase/IMP cyclohydrolase